MHTIHEGALENHTKSNNITKSLTELKKGIEVMERTNVTITFGNIRTSTCFMINLTLKHIQL